MEIPNDIMEYVESCWRWDDDMRQDVYMKILDLPDGTEINKAWCVKVYENLKEDARKVEARRVELRRDNHALIVSRLGLDSAADTPEGVLAAEAAATRILRELSPLLRATAEQHYMEGMTPEEIADAEGVDSAAIYKRLQRVRDHLKGAIHGR